MRFQRLVTNPNSTIKKWDAIGMGLALISTELEDLIAYARALKMLAVYLAEKTYLDPKSLACDCFHKAEEHLFEQLRRELKIGTQE